MYLWGDGSMNDLKNFLRMHKKEELIDIIVEMNLVMIALKGEEE